MTKEVDAIEPNAVADIPGPDLNTKTPHPKAPPGSCDCHHHIFGAPNKVALNPGRQYTPAEGTLAQFEAKSSESRTLSLSSRAHMGSTTISFARRSRPWVRMAVGSRLPI